MCDPVTCFYVRNITLKGEKINKTCPAGRMVPPAVLSRSNAAQARPKCYLFTAEKGPPERHFEPPSHETRKG